MLPGITAQLNYQHSLLVSGSASGKNSEEMGEMVAGSKDKKQLRTSKRKQGWRVGQEPAHEGSWRLGLGFVNGEATDDFSVEDRPGLYFRMTPL